MCKTRTTLKHRNYFKVYWLKCVCLDGPRNPTIILIHASLKTEIRLECFADGNPPPNYEWGIVGKIIPLNNGSIVVISKSMITDEEQTLRCTAWNYVAGQIRSTEATYKFSPTRKKILNMHLSLKLND